MTVMFSYNFKDAESVHNSRMQSMFERFGWQNVGGSCYRYPSLASGTIWPEDWFNRVIPALMCFRAYTIKHQLNVPKFSLDVQASTGYDAATTPPVGAPPTTITVGTFAQNANQQFGAKQLETWLLGTETSIPY